MMGQCNVTSFTLTVADNGYILEYYLDKKDDECVYDIKKVYTNVDLALDTIREICHNKISSL